MIIQQSFEVVAPLERVWAMFQDVPSIAQCLPGAELGTVLGDGRYAGRITVGLGPMSFGFEGEAIVVADEATRSGTIHGRGVDKKGGSRGSVRLTYALEPAEAATLGRTEAAALGPTPGVPPPQPAEPGTRVRLETDLTLAGPVAQFGRTGLIEEVSKRLLGQFVACLEARLAASSADEAAAITAADVGAASLLLGAVRDRFKRGDRGG